MNFENLTYELYVLYVFNTHVKFCSNKMLFTIPQLFPRVVLRARQGVQMKPLTWNFLFIYFI